MRWHERARDDVQIAVAVEIDRLRPVRPRECGQRVLRERKRPRVLEPLDPVIRLQELVVEACRRSSSERRDRRPCRDRRPGFRKIPSWDEARCRWFLRIESQAAAIEERHDGLVFLREQRDEVGPAVAVRDRRAPRESLPYACRSDGERTTGWRSRSVSFFRSVRSPVRRQPNAATARSSRPSPSKSAASTSATRGPRCDRDRRVRPVLASAQPEDRPAIVVARQEAAEVGDQKVELRHRDRDRAARRARDSTAARSLRSTPARRSQLHRLDDAAAHVAHQHRWPSIPVQFDQPEVRHRVVRGLRELRGSPAF